MIQTDVLIIGSGGAGLRAAIEVHDNNVDVLVVGKCKKRDAHTILATGGINAALANVDKKDNWKIHAADTIRDGGMINNPQAVITLAKNAPKAVTELEKWGTTFNTLPNGTINQRFFGAATYRRACFVGDYTGKHILTALVQQTNKRKIPMRSEVYIFSLLHKNNEINGALGLDLKSGKILTFKAKIVVLATGGHSRMFTRSSSRFWENNGDGIALAHQVKAHFMDMEMFQFHPTGMVTPASAEGVLVTEAVRGEGGVLTNSKGERFMEQYDKERMELSARDVVARAIWSEIHNGRGTKHNAVWLDISQKPKSFILKRLPRMYKQFKDYLNIDISTHKMEVAPTAHYSMGGIAIDHKTGKTTVRNLYAVGEVTSGIHGGNRLGGNSLAEICVFGRLTGKHIAKIVKSLNHTELDQDLLHQKIYTLQSLRNTTGTNPIKAKKELQLMMWEHCGVIRNAKSLREGLRKLENFKKLTLKIPAKVGPTLIAALDFKNMLPTCEMILQSALKRKESRAAHFRSDYPTLNPSQQKNIYCIPTQNGFTLKFNPIPPIPPDIKKIIGSKIKRNTELLE